jgi:flagellar export protein FliJ
MPFRFPLATVLRVRESLEKREERALQKIQLEMARVSHQIEELTARIAKSHNARELAMAQPIPARDLHTLLWEVQAAAEEKKALHHDLQTLEQQRDQQIKVYRQAHRDRETMTDMSNKQRDIYEQEQARAQQKSLDDIFIARRHRS